MTADTSWLPYVYVYSIGGLLYLAGMMIALRSGAMNLSTRRGRVILLLLVGGMLFFLAFHFFFQFVAPDLAPAAVAIPRLNGTATVFRQYPARTSTSSRSGFEYATSPLPCPLTSAVSPDPGGEPA